MLAIKTTILRKIDSYPPGIRICAVKFLQRVVQTQTLGVIADPRVRIIHSNLTYHPLTFA
jgi:symplekin